MADKDKHDAGKNEAEKRRERDQRIIDQLRSSDDADRAAGMVQVEQTFRIPLAIVLYRNAWDAKSAAFEMILDVSLRLDRDAFDEIWQHTKACLYENTQKDDFKFKGNLLAYLAKIAQRRIVYLWRKQCSGTLTDDLGFLDFLGGPDNSHEKAGLLDLLDAIERFVNTLSESEQTVLWIGVRFATDGSSKEGWKMFAEKVRCSGAWHGSDGTILRRYRRLRERLRQFLKEEGYNV